MVLMVLVHGVSALSITVSPEQIERGDQVIISVIGLPDNSTFSMQIEGTFAATPGGPFSFETRNLVLPFALNDGSLSATLRNTDTNILIVKKGDTEVKKVGLSQNGFFSTTDSGSIPAGMYDSISLGGTAAADATSIVASVTLQGRKSGPINSEISFVVDGVTEGRVSITIWVDGGIALSRTIQIGNPVTVTPTWTYSGGGGGGGSTTVSGITATTTMTTVPTTVQTSPATTAPTVAETATPTGAAITAEVATTPEQQVPTSPAPIGSPLPACLVPLGIALVILVCALKRR
ncbi:MAG: hypothetical protein MUC66_08535 [Methanolinea sp.]|nr:hypothetical protein [Methanolinea sp.]